MINDQLQKQEGGDSSTNVQGKSVVIYQGISFADAKEIALDVYKSNFMQLSREAVQVARERAEEITDDFLSKLKKENEQAVASLKDPGMQSALFEAQKQYAKTGDKNLEGLLVDILVERASLSERNIRQIVLDESLGVASKLTTEQMDALTVNFLLVKTRNMSLNNLDLLGTYLDSHILPFLAELTDKSTCYEHLEYVGCGSVIHTGNLRPIEHFFRRSYPGLFAKGFDENRFNAEIGIPQDYEGLIIKCLHDSDKYQLNGIDRDTIQRECKKRNISEEITKKMLALYNSTTMSEAEIRDYLIKLKPEIARLFDLWKTSLLSKFSLTTVGIAIAQANFRRRTNLKLDLSIWIT